MVRAFLHMPQLVSAGRISPEERKALLLAFIAGILPLSRPLASLGIGLLLIHELWQYSLTKKACFSAPLKASILLFVLYAVSVFYSTDWLFAWHKLETKFCLLLCPLLLGLNFTPRAGRYLPGAFITGNLLAVLYSLIRAVLDSFYTGVNHFHYMKLSEYLHFHPTVFSLYLFMAIFLLVDKLMINWLEPTSPQSVDGAEFANSYFVSFKGLKPFRFGYMYGPSVALILLFLFFILLLSARMAMLSGFVLLGVSVFLWLKTHWSTSKSLLALLLVLILSLSVAWSIPSTRFRLQVLLQGIEKNKETSNVRWEIWDASYFLIDQGSFWGYGLGDVGDALMTTYEEFDYCKPYSEHYNAHNQFLETTLAIGWPGLLVFLMLFFTAFRQINKEAEKKKISGHSTTYLFLFLLLANFLTESLLETQQALMFFTLFFSYFFSNCRESSSTQAIYSRES